MPQSQRELSFGADFAEVVEQARVSPISVMRPKLPTAAQIAPYLEEIDGNRWYSNFGPLADRFEKRLSARFGGRMDSVLAVTNGTIGLTLALQAVAPLPGDLCMLPGFTFTASASAVIAAGLVPWFVDVDPATWALEPEQAKYLLKHAPGRVAAVMPVSVFGRPVNTGAWDRFTADTGIPAVIDGAASFDAAELGQSPVMISLHATKVFGVGEGGLILSRDPGVISSIRSLSSFGFSLKPGETAESRSAQLPGTNGKMSEYAAAVGLAGLDNWSATRARFLKLRDEYLWIMADLPGFKPQPGGREPWASATINFETQLVSSKSLIASLAQSGIQARRWWGDGCYNEPAFAACPRNALPVSEQVIDRVIGLPFYIDMTSEEMLRVKKAIAEVLR